MRSSRHPLATSPDDLPPPPEVHRRHGPRFFAALAVAVLALSCGGEGPVQLPAQPDDVLPESPETRDGSRLKPDPGALSIADLLGDPFFQALVQGIDEPELSAWLLASVDALESGRLARARHLLADARAEAEALQHDPDAAEALLLWSAIELYLENADLM